MAAQVATLVRLKWRLDLRSLTRNPGALIAVVVLAPLALAGVIMAVIALVSLRGAGPDTQAVAVLGLTLLSAMWLGVGALIAVTAPGLSVRSFATLPLAPARLALGLFAGTLTGVPALALALVCAAGIVTWAGAWGPGLVAAVAMPLGLVTTLLITRTVLQLLEGLFTSARGRTVGAVLAALIPLTPMLLNLGLSGHNPISTLEGLRSGAVIAGWTPFGWAWAAPWDVAGGRPVVAGIKLLLTAGLIAGLWVVYVRGVRHAVLTAPAGSSRRITSRSVAGQRGPAWLAGPVVAIARRRAVTWRRDDRMLGVLLQYLVIPGLLVAQAFFSDQGIGAGVGLFVLAVAPGMSLASDLALDGSAFSLHVASGVRGWQDRLGRVLAHVLVLCPWVLLGWALLTATGQLGYPWRWLAFLLAILPFGLGLGAVVGSRFIGRAPPPRGRPFASGAGGAEAILSGLIMMTVPGLGALPVVGLAALPGRVLPDTTLVHILVVLTGLVYGLAFLVFGVIRGGRTLDLCGVDRLDDLRYQQ